MNLAILLLLLGSVVEASAQEPTRKDPLLDRLAGSWILQGTIAGRKTTHDIESEWVLNHEYLRFRETSREKNIKGEPAYEAIVIMEWEQSSNEYRCLWLDSTGGGGLLAPIAQGKRGDDEITLWFGDKDKDGSTHTSFVYNKGADTWSWLIDNESGGKADALCARKAHQKVAPASSED